jgi:hypothetical protein
VKLKGLVNTRGWEEREMEVKGEARWVVKTRERRLDEDGKWEDVVVEERIPLPENYRLGLEGKGVDVNNSSRYRNEFGKNNKPLFPSKGKGRGEETRNWIASFNRSGCVGCKDVNDSLQPFYASHTILGSSCQRCIGTHNSLSLEPAHRLIRGTKAEHTTLKNHGSYPKAKRHKTVRNLRQSVDEF